MSSASRSKVSGQAARDIAKFCWLITLSPMAFTYSLHLSYRIYYLTLAIYHPNVLVG